MSPQQLQALRSQKSQSLKRLRENLDITKSKLIRLSGLDYRTITKIESGVECWNVDSEIIYTEALRILEAKRFYKEKVI